MPSVLMYPQAPAEMSSEPAYQPSSAPLIPQVLRQTGARPRAVDVRLMAHGTSYGAPLSYWYELNLWQTAEGSYIADIRLFRKSDENNDEFFLFETSDLDDAVSQFEQFNPRNHVTVDFSLSDEGQSTADLAVHAIQLKHDLEVATRHYKSLVSKFLQDL